MITINKIHMFCPHPPKGEKLNVVHHFWNRCYLIIKIHIIAFFPYHSNAHEPN